MSDWAAGLLAVTVGAVFCFQGHVAMRIIISIWGALAGFALGGGIAAGDGGFLSSTLSWILAMVIGLLFALAAYLYYELSIAIAMGSIGFTLGASALVLFGVTWSWLIALSGLALGIALAVFAIASDLPMMLLIVLSATAGASAIVGGVMLLTGALDAEQITRSAGLTDELNDDWYWYALWFVAAIAGFVTQISTNEAKNATARAAWDDHPRASPAANV